MADAIDVLVADLLGNTVSAQAQPLIATVADMVAALKYIQGGLAPSGPEAANTVFAGPATGSPALPTFRALTAADIPATLDATTFIGDGVTCPNGSAGTPALNFGDATTGLYRPAANQIAVSVSGAQQFLWAASSYRAANAAGPSLQNAAATGVVPTFIPNRANANAGIGADVAGDVSLIADNAGTATEVSRATGTQYQARLPFLPVQGIVGVTDGSNAAAGIVGEYISATVSSGAAVALANGVSKSIVTLNLSAGDWDVEGNGWYQPGGNLTVVTAAVSPVLDTLPPAPFGINRTAGIVSTTSMSSATGSVRVVSNAPVTVYLVLNASFTVSCNGYGFLGARRRR